MAKRYNENENFMFQNIDVPQDNEENENPTIPNQQPLPEAQGVNLNHRSTYNNRNDRNGRNNVY